MAKRYYWLKLPEDFFRQLPIKKLRRIAGGDTYTVIYLKMLLLSLKQDGRIYFEGVEENFSEELALELDEEEENVKVTVRFLLAHGLMKLVDETEYVLTQCSNMVGSESASAERVRRHRENKALQCNVDVTDVKRIDDVTLTYTKNSAVFKSDEYTIYTRLIEGNYFPYQKMFTVGEINTCASRTVLIGAMTRAKMCTEEKQPVVFQIEDDVLNISIRDKLADYQEQVPLQETVCKSIRLGFDSKLVLETLKAFTCDNIALGFTSPRTPMIVEAEDSDMKAMVLPVAIREA